ncbi:MAG: transposase [Terriglobia bacterium]
MIVGLVGEAIISEADALLLEETDRATRLTVRFAGCFNDRRNVELVGYRLGTLVMRRAVGLVLAYENPNDYDPLRMVLGMAIRRAESFMIAMTAIVICRSMCSAGDICWRRSCGAPPSAPSTGR